MNKKTVNGASGGTCAVVGCGNVADVEVQERVAPDTWRVTLACMDHLTTDELALVESAVSE